MRFLTVTQAREWCGQGLVRFDSGGLPLHPSVERHHVRLDIPQSYAQLSWFCRHLEQSLRPRDGCLLWVTDWGIWGSSENLHLYYRLRQSYGDRRLLREAPAHFFLEYEAADLVSFVAVGIQCGWDMHLLPFTGYARAFISHDEFVEFASDDHNPNLVEEFAAELRPKVNPPNG